MAFLISMLSSSGFTPLLHTPEASFSTFYPSFFPRHFSVSFRFKCSSQKSTGIKHLPMSVSGVLSGHNDTEVYLQEGETWSIHKFGGTCMGTAERIKNVAKLVIDDDPGNKVAVVSAISKVTDMMYDLVNQAKCRADSYIVALDAVLEKHRETACDLLDGDDLTIFLSKLCSDVEDIKAVLRAIYIAGHATDSFTDFIVGHGELWSAHLLSFVVRKKGVECIWMDAREVVVVKPISCNQVEPEYKESKRRLDKWVARNPSKIIVATGFIASTADNIPITLKRDGSDFSAAILGALFKASKVTIWTDVNGVYSADPRKVSEAVVLRKLSYQEAWEMSYFGANVLHPRTMLPVMQFGIPIAIRNMFNHADPGTVICRHIDSPDDGNGLESPVKGFATIDNLALVNVEGTGMMGVPGTASAIFQAARDVGSNVIMISQASSEHSICFAVPEDEVTAVADILQSRFRQELDSGRLSKVDIIPNCSILAAVGLKMASTPGVSATLFNALAKANVNVRAIAQGCSEYNVTIVLKREDCVRALKAVHSRFYLSRTAIAVGIVGPGLVGGTLLDQLKDQAGVLKGEFNIDLRVMGITDSKTMLLGDNKGVDLGKWREDMQKKGEEGEMEKFVEHVKGNHFIPNTLLVDCTSDSSVASHYFSWLRKGIHVITPNKKANSGPLHQYLRLRSLRCKSYAHYFYEATVGAGLPVISTLRGLLETGDKILHIQGILSGTLSYIFNNLSGRSRFSQVVAEATKAGYTEPDPRDDLYGTDVARKVLILARECGLKMDMEDIAVESLVPEPLKGCASAEEFVRLLPEFDIDLSKRIEDADNSGEVLRYVGVVDVVKAEGWVEVRKYARGHPFAQLSGSDNIIAFTTKRYHPCQPLIIRGPGAGAHVTAAGIFSDILRLASCLGAPS